MGEQKKELAPCALCRASSWPDGRRWRGVSGASSVPFPGRRRALADALDRKSSWRPAGDCWIPLIFCAASGGSKASAQAHEKLRDGAGVRCGDGSAKRTARRAAACLGVARWRLRPGQRARAQGASCKIARCAANMGAVGRRAVGGGRGTCCGTCEAVRAPQGQHLTVLLAAAAAESHENLLCRMPHAMAHGTCVLMCVCSVQCALKNKDKTPPFN